MKIDNKWIAWSAFALVGGLMMQSCHESLEERAARECKEYTERNCPQQLGNGVVYDSLTFEIPTQTVHHHYSVTGEADNAQAFAEHTNCARRNSRDYVATSPRRSIRRQATISPSPSGPDAIPRMFTSIRSLRPRN